MFSETLKLVQYLMKGMQLYFLDEFSSIGATLPTKYVPTVQQTFS
jgi:hypothetical protein